MFPGFNVFSLHAFCVFIMFLNYNFCSLYGSKEGRKEGMKEGRKEGGGVFSVYFNSSHLHNKLENSAKLKISLAKLYRLSQSCFLIKIKD